MTHKSVPSYALRKYIYTFQHFSWLFLAILLFTILLTTVVFRPSNNYSVNAVLWAKQPIVFKLIGSTQQITTESAAANQAHLLQESVASSSFVEQVTNELEVAGFSFNTTQLSSLRAKIYKDLQVNPVGEHTISLKYSDIDPKLTLNVVNVVIKDFTDATAARIKAQSSTVLQLLSQQVSSAENKLGDSNQALQQYLSANPGVVRTLDNADGKFLLSNADLQYQILLQTVLDARQTYNDLYQNLQKLKVNANDYASGKNPIVEVYDQPVIVSSIVFNGLSRFLIGLLLGLLVGLQISILIALLISWSNYTLRDQVLTRHSLRVPLVFELPTSVISKQVPATRWPQHGIRKYLARENLRVLSLGLLGIMLAAGLGILTASNPLLGILLTALSLGFAIISRWPQVGYFLAIFIVLPCEIFPNPDGITTYSVLPLSNLNAYTSIPVSATPLEVLLAFTALICLLHIGLGRKKISFKFNLTSLLVVVFGVFLLFSYIYGVYLKHGDIKAAQWEVRAPVYIVVLYFLSLYFLPERRYWKVLGWLLPFGISLMCAITIYRFFIFSQTEPGGLYQESINGFDHEASLLFVILIIWSISKLLFGSSWQEKVIGFFLLFPGFFCILVANRRAAFVSLAISLVFVLIVMFRRRRKAFVICLLLLVFILPPYVIAFKNVSGPLGTGARAFASVSSEPGSRDYYSDLYRLIEKNNVILTIKTAPLTGIGFGQAFNRYIEFLNLDGFVFQYYTPHVQVLWLWLKLGVFGWGVFWLLICLTVFKFGQVIKYNVMNKQVTMVVLAGCIICTIMVYAYLDLAFVNTRLMTLLGVAIGLINVAYNIHTEHKSRLQKHQRLETEFLAPDRQLQEAFV